MVLLSLYPQFETNLMSNRNVIKLFVQLKSAKAYGKNYIKVRPPLVAIFSVIVYYIKKFSKNFNFTWFHIKFLDSFNYNIPSEWMYWKVPVLAMFKIW